MNNHNVDDAYVSEINFIKISDYIFPPNHPINNRIGITSLTDEESKQLKPNCVIYLCMNHIQRFVEQTLPNIQVPFYLITGISDYITPYLSEKNKWDGYHKLLDNQYLIKWACLNKDYPDHPKLILIPIGIHRCYVIHNKEYNYIGYYIDASGHEFVAHTFMTNNSEDILEKMKNKQNSDNLLYINYTSESSRNANSNEGFRYDLDEYIKNSEFKKSELKIWEEYISELKTYKFTIEPHGRCFNGYRLYESIIMGTVPIVFSSSINELYEDLPILVIDKFTDLNKTFLEQKYIEIISKTDYKFEKLKMKHWLDLIFGKDR